MLSLNLPSSLEGWRVSDEATLSDHKCIDFSLGLGPNSCTEAVPNLAKAKWDKFWEILGNKSFGDPQYITQCQFDTATLRFENCLKWALYRVCLLCRDPHKVKRPHYWEGGVEELRKLVRWAWRRYSHSHTDDSWTAHLESRWAIQRRVRRAKREAWKLFTKGTSDSKAMLQLFKIVEGRENHSINVLSDASVGGSEDLMDVHFPSSTNLVLGERKTSASGALLVPIRQLTMLHWPVSWKQYPALETPRQGAQMA